MKPWVREMLQEQGIEFSSVEEEMAYDQKRLEESKVRYSQDALLRGGDADRARYEQGAFDRQSADYALQRNREADSIARRWTFE
jgi:hypothetical protein